MFDKISILDKIDTNIYSIKLLTFFFLLSYSMKSNYLIFLVNIQGNDNTVTISNPFSIILPSFLISVNLIIYT